jgi:hypothetical protein
MDAAGRCADGENLDRVIRHRPKRSVQNPSHRRNRRGPAVLGIAEGLQAREKDFREASIEAARAGLGKSIGSPERQGRDSLLSALLGHRRYDHDVRAAGIVEDARDRAQAARAGHLQIEQDRVDANRLKRVDRILGRTRNGGELERIVAFDHPRQHRASDDAVVDDHQSDAAVFYWRGRLAVPRTGERPLHGQYFQATPTS